MIQSILNLYYTSVIISMMVMMLNQINTKRDAEDPIELMKKADEALDDIENETLRKGMINLIDNIFDNKMLGYFILFAVCIIPIFNILISFSMMKSLLGMKDNKHEK